MLFYGAVINDVHNLKSKTGTAFMVTCWHASSLWCYSREIM